MKAKMILSLVIGMVLVFGFCGLVVAGGGGPEDPVCTGDLPSADSGYFLRGEFISAGSYDDTVYGKVIPVAISLKKGNTSRLFSFKATFTNVCTVTAAQLAETFKWEPCKLGVAEAFGLVGVPVITSLEITQTDHCDIIADRMIRGEIVIRVVPLK
jgi:hypothetical protein